MDKQNLTDAEIDQIIAEVEQTLSKAENLSKAFPPSEEKPEQEEAAAPPQEESAAPPPEAASPEAPPAEAPAPTEESAPALSEAPAEEPPPEEGQAPEANGEEELSAEGDDAPLTDEELEQIYSSMAPEELERHYMVIRQHMQNAYAQQDQQAAPEAPAPPAPAPEQAPEQSLAMSEKQSELNKSEFDSLKSENAELKKETESIKKSLDLMVKAIEAGFTPQRKSVEGLEFIKKSSAEESKGEPMSKSEVKSKLEALYQDSSKVSSLSKSDRDAVDSYLLHGTNQPAVEKILNLGGKQ